MGKYLNLGVLAKLRAGKFHTILKLTRHLQNMGYYLFFLNTSV